MDNIAMLVRVGAEKGRDGGYSLIFEDNSFIYLPISESKDSIEDLTYRDLLYRSGFSDISFFNKNKIDSKLHYDPYFNEIYTYGDGTEQRFQFLKLNKGDLLIFYGTFSRYGDAELYNSENMYIFGYFEVNETIHFKEINSALVERYKKQNKDFYKILAEDWRKVEEFYCFPDEIIYNAHFKRYLARRAIAPEKYADFVIVFGHPNHSRLLKNAILISERDGPRNLPYTLKKDLADLWNLKSGDSNQAINITRKVPHTIKDQEKFHFIKQEFLKIKPKISHYNYTMMNPMDGKKLVSWLRNDSEELNYFAGLKALENQNYFVASKYLNKISEKKKDLFLKAKFFHFIAKCYEQEKVEYNEILEHVRIFPCYLRTPISSRDKRNDPYYKYGNFGSTGCHSTNLLNPKTIQDRFFSENIISLLMFIQGGKPEKESRKIPKIPFISYCIESLEKIKIKIKTKSSCNVKNEKYQEYCCALYWRSFWKNKWLRPLKFDDAFKIDLEIAKKIKPEFEKKSKSIYDFYRFVRKTSKPINLQDSIDLFLDYMKWRIRLFKEKNDDAFIDNDWETLARKDQKKVEKARSMVN
ncbi:MAG: hypothetical protein ACP6IY_18025 [Promethearchaeia archaeon]